MLPLGIRYAVQHARNGRFLAERRWRGGYSGNVEKDFTCCPRLFSKPCYAQSAVNLYYERHASDISVFRVVKIYLCLDKPVVRVQQKENINA